MTKQEQSISSSEKSINLFFNLKTLIHNGYMPTIDVQCKIPVGYKGKVVIDVSDIEPNPSPTPTPSPTPSPIPPIPIIVKPNPKSKKLPKNWDRKLKARGPDGRFIKDSLDHKKIKLECQLKHSKGLFDCDSCLN